MSCADPLPIRALERNFRPAPDQDQVIQVDPRPADGQLSTTRMPPDNGFFEPAPYKGAFGGTLWSAKWTNMDRLGYLPFCDVSILNNAIPSEVESLTIDRLAGNETELTWTEPPLANSMGHQLYDVLRSDVPDDFDPSTCIEENDADRIAIDPEVPADGEVFYYLIQAVNDCGFGPLGFMNPGAARPVNPAGNCM
jgi:hypothetical protein